MAGTGYVHDILAYAIYAHGSNSESPNWQMESEGWLRYQEVAALWYYTDIGGTEVDVHPWGMIVHAMVCWGYSGVDGQLHMAKSFVDYGAAVFVGARLSIPETNNDGFIDDFRASPCQNDRTVYTAPSSTSMPTTIITAILGRMAVESRYMVILIQSSPIRLSPAMIESLLIDHTSCGGSGTSSTLSPSFFHSGFRPGGTTTTMLPS